MAPVLSLPITHYPSARSNLPVVFNPPAARQYNIPLLIRPAFPSNQRLHDTTTERVPQHNFLLSLRRRRAMRRERGWLPSTTPLQPPRRCSCTSSQSGNPLPYAIHHGVPTSLENAQLTHHRIVLRHKLACENNLASAIHLPELAQAPRRGSAQTYLVSHAFTEARNVAAAAAVGARA